MDTRADLERTTNGHVVDAATQALGSARSSTDTLVLNVRTVAQLTSQMSASADLVLGESRAWDEEMGRTRADAKALVTRMAALEKSLAGIEQVMQQISSIALQTKILALNATIEAARAGDVGLGFSVVAEAVGELARETTEATLKVSATIQTTKRESRETTAAVGRLEARTQEVQTLLDRARARLSEQSQVGRSVATVLGEAEGEVEAVVRAFDAAGIVGSGHPRTADDAE